MKPLDWPEYLEESKWFNYNLVLFIFNAIFVGVNANFFCKNWVNGGSWWINIVGFSASLISAVFNIIRLKTGK